MGNYKGKKNNEIDIKLLILLIIIVSLVTIILIVILKKIVIPKANDGNYKSNISNSIVVNNTNETKTTIPTTDEEIIKYLSTLGERDRMQYYCGKFFNYIYKAKYEDAYKLLNSDFKSNYFPTQEEFEEYIENAFPTFYGIEYDDISRQGDLYVLRLKIVDFTNVGKSESESTNEEEDNIQRVVIRENYYNDFEMSFQVK